MESFNFYQPTRVHFGAGRLNEVGRIVGKYGKKCMLVTTTNQEDVLRPLYDRVKGLLAEAGVENHSLTNFDVIAQIAAEENYIRPEDVARLIAFRNNPSDESWITK